MAYVRSMREIPLTEEPHASVLAAILPPFDPDDPGADLTPVLELSPRQITHLTACRACSAVVGGVGQAVGGSPDVSTPETKEQS